MDTAQSLVLDFVVSGGAIEIWCLPILMIRVFIGLVALYVCCDIQSPVYEKNNNLKIDWY